MRVEYQSQHIIAFRLEARLLSELPGLRSECHLLSPICSSRLGPAARKCRFASAYKIYGILST